jgi:hypothetical protein
MGADTSVPSSAPNRPRAYRRVLPKQMNVKSSVTVDIPIPEALLAHFAEPVEQKVSFHNPAFWKIIVDAEIPDVILFPKVRFP